LSLVVGAAVLVALACRFAGKLPPALSEFQPGWALLYLATAAIVVAAHAARWQLIGRALNASLPIGRLIAARLAGEAVGAVMPSAKIAGDPVRIALVYTDGLPGPSAGAGVALDRVAEVAGNILAAILYVVVFASTYHGRNRSPVFQVLVSLLVLLPALLFPLLMLRAGRRPLAPLYQWAKRRRGGWKRVAAAAHATEGQLADFLSKHPQTFLLGVAASLFIEGLVIIEYELLLRTFAVRLPLPTLLVALVFSGLSRAVPTPVGLGALEGSQVVALAIAGHTAAAGFLVGLIMRVHETLLTGIGLAVCLTRGLSLARLRLIAAADKAVA